MNTGRVVQTTVMFALVGTLIIAAIAPTMHKQDVAAFNDDHNQFVYNTHNHLKCSESSCDETNSVTTV
jgi:hypothetical protein